jgi:protein involved in sex pheromone biosynthesis
LLKEKLSISLILRAYRKQFTQIIGRYNDGRNGRCSIDVIMSYYGWDGKDDSHIATKLVGALIALRYVGIDKNLIIQLNDSDGTFDEIADYLR